MCSEADVQRRSSLGQVGRLPKIRPESANWDEAVRIPPLSSAFIDPGGRYLGPIGGYRGIWVWMGGGTKLCSEDTLGGWER